MTIRESLYGCAKFGIMVVIPTFLPKIIGTLDFFEKSV